MRRNFFIAASLLLATLVAPCSSYGNTPAEYKRGVEFAPKIDNKALDGTMAGVNCYSYGNTTFTGFVPQKGSDTFKGKVHSEKVRFIYPQLLKAHAPNNNYSLQLSYQIFDPTKGNHHRSMSDYSALMISDFVDVSKPQSGSVKLNPVTLNLKVNITPKNLDKSQTTHLFVMELRGKTLTSDALFNLKLDSNDNNFISRRWRGTISVTPSEHVEIFEGKTTSIDLSMLPFDLSKSDEVQLSFHYVEGVGSRIYTTTFKTSKLQKYSAGNSYEWDIDLDLSKTEKIEYVSKDPAMVNGAAFFDRYLPLAKGTISADCWGSHMVVPRNISNGAEHPDYSFWGGNILKGDDGKYHIYVARWPENISRSNGVSGHDLWWDSDVVHCISDSPTGPYVYHDYIGKGHNPEIYRNFDGTYVIGVMGFKAYTSKSLYGPWTEIETKFKFIDKKQNNTNRTYIVEKDSVYMISKEGAIFSCREGIENFVEMPYPLAYKRVGGSMEEDPVIWKDEICYNLIVHRWKAKTAFHLTSKDGSSWQYEEGVAYTPYIFNNEEGTREFWWSVERPKVLTDKYGRPEYINFAVIDTLKRGEVANDNHSSKNIIVPLRIARRMEISSPAKVKPSTNQITILLLAEEGYDLSKIDYSSLRLGSSSFVNRAKGLTVASKKKVKRGVEITFKGKSTGLESSDYKIKLLGSLKNGEPIWSFARLDGRVLGVE